MLKLSLTSIQRGEEVRIREQVPVSDPLLEGLEVSLSAPVDVDLSGRSVGDGVLVRGEVKTSARVQCRRCLEEVERGVDFSVDLLFMEPEEGDEEADGEVYPLPARGNDLDLSGPVREQLVLNVPEFVVCREECRGLCPRCGTDLNQGDCECEPEEVPSPWDALKKLKLD